MFRALLIHAAKGIGRPASLISGRQPYQQFVRYQSDKINDERRKALEHANDMLRDWDARVLTYAEVKPKTLNPRLVRFLLPASASSLLSFSRRTHT